MKTKLLFVAAACIAVILLMGFLGQKGVWAKIHMICVPESADFKVCVRSALRDLGLSENPKFTSKGDIFMALPPRKSTDPLFASIQQRNGNQAAIIFAGASKPDDCDEVVPPLQTSLAIAIVGHCAAK